MRKYIYIYIFTARKEHRAYVGSKGKQVLSKTSVVSDYFFCLNNASVVLTKECNLM